MLTLISPDLSSSQRKPGASQSGITGLETAIILIAFVVVASVFAFTVLSAGVFSSERSKETIHEGLEETRTTLAPRGGMIAIRGTVDGSDAIVQLRFNLYATGDGEVIDLTPPYVFDDSGADPDPSGLESRATVSYTDGSQHINDLAWSARFVGGDNGDYLLDLGETAEVTVWLNELTVITGTYTLGAPGTPYLAAPLRINTQFSLLFDATRGSTVTMQRTTPSRLTPVLNLQ